MSAIRSPTGDDRGMDRITFRAPDALIDELDQVVETEGFASRSELLRAAIRDLEASNIHHCDNCGQAFLGEHARNAHYARTGCQPHSNGGDGDGGD